MPQAQARHLRDPENPAGVTCGQVKARYTTDQLADATCRICRQIKGAPVDPPAPKPEPVIHFQRLPSRAKPYCNLKAAKSCQLTTVWDKVTCRRCHAHAQRKAKKAARRQEITAAAAGARP